MAGIDSIAVRGFKSFASLEAKLEPVNILIGANGSGKSNFLEAFSFLRAIGEERVGEYVSRAGGTENILHFGSRNTSELEFGLRFARPVEGFDSYSIKFARSEHDSFGYAGEFAHRVEDPSDASRVSEGESSVYLPGNPASFPPSRQFAPLRKHLKDLAEGWRVYRFQDTSPLSPMKRTNDLHDNRFLRADGANLAAYLYLLKHRHEPSYDLIRDVVGRVAPFFEDFVLEPQELNRDKILLEWRHRHSDARFYGSSFSDGTLRFIALATLLLQPAEKMPSILLIDEPELGLHPYAISTLASMIELASETTRVVAATQSPALLDCFSPEAVLVADRVAGATRLTRLGSAALESWLEEYSLGQLWEKNVVGGRPGGGDR